jgi:hypothetical protein
MEQNGDNRPSGQDQIKPEVDTPEARAAKLISGKVDDILSMARELNGRGKGARGDNFDSRDVNNGLLVHSTGASVEVMGPDKKQLYYSILSNRDGQSDDHPGSDRVTVEGRHTDLETLSKAQEYMRNHPGELTHRNFSTTYYVNKSNGELERVSKVPDDFVETFPEATEQYTRDFRGEMAKTSPMTPDDIKDARAVVERISEELNLAKESPQE